MKNVLLPTATVLMVLVGSCRCKPPQPKPDIGRCGNTCIMTKISLFAGSSTICDSSARVSQYKFLSDTVYVFDKGTCGNDFSSPVLNSQCDTLGELGGISGNDNIFGLSFSANSTFLGTIWEN